MNEIELIRAQLSTERCHAAEVASACAAAVEAPERFGKLSPELDDFRRSCVDYLVFALTRFEAREQMLHDLLNSRLATGDERRRVLDELIARPGTSREALARLEAALGGGIAAPAGRTTSSGEDARTRPWGDFLQFFNDAWSTRRAALDELFEGNARITDWRAVSLVDADSILDERNRYGRVQALLPAGIELRAGS